MGPDDVSIAVELDSRNAADAAEDDEEETVEAVGALTMVLADAPTVLKMACARRVRVPDTKSNNTCGDIECLTRTDMTRAQHSGALA